MAQRTVIQLVDDLNGKELSADEGETVSFGLDGISYEIDLGAKNAKALRDALQAYISSGRKLGRRGNASSQRRSHASGSNASRTREIREWARKNGHKVSQRGRISAEVAAAYDAAR